MCVSCLQKFAAQLKEKHVDSATDLAAIQIDPYQKELGFLVMECVTVLICQNSANASKNYSFE